MLWLRSHQIRSDFILFFFVSGEGCKGASDREEGCGGEQVCRSEMLFIEIPLLLLSAGDGGAGGGGMEAGEGAGELWKVLSGRAAGQGEERGGKRSTEYPVGCEGAPCARMGHVSAFDMSPAQVRERVGGGGGGGGVQKEEEEEVSWSCVSRRGLGRVCDAACFRSRVEGRGFRVLEGSVTLFCFSFPFLSPHPSLSTIPLSQSRPFAPIIP